MQAGHYAGRRIRLAVSGRGPGEPFRYRDLGSAAYIARGKAVVSAGRARFSGFTGWVFWLFIHIAFLTGFRNRVGAVLTWWLAFTRDVRRERAFTAREIGQLPSVYGPGGGQAGEGAGSPGQAGEAAGTPGQERRH